MSKQRAKGTAWETELLPHVRWAFWNDDIERAGTTKGIADWGDFLGTPILVEAKKTDVPHFLQWAKTCQRKARDRWMVAWSGDRRKGDGPYALVPLELLLELLHHRYEDGSE